jgi:hypothetical protein
MVIVKVDGRFQRRDALCVCRDKLILGAKQWIREDEGDGRWIVGNTRLMK